MRLDQLPSDWQNSPDPVLAPGTNYNVQTTFKDVDGAPLALKGLNRPFNRCLNLQARLARQEAIKKRWISDHDPDFPDFWSDVDHKPLVEDWLDSL